MDLQTNTVQLGLDSIPFYERNSRKGLQSGHDDYLEIGQASTEQHLAEIDEWNQLQHKKRPKRQQQVTQDLQHAQFPKFYRNELKHAFTGLLGAFVILLVFAGGMITIILSINSHNRSWHLLWLTLPLALFTLYCAYHGINNYLTLRSESQQISFSKYERQPSVNMIKIYRKVRTGYLNLNWFGAGIYLIGGLVIICTLVVAWAYNLIQSATRINEFGAIKIYASGDWWPLYVISGTGFVLGLYLVFHVWSLFKNHHRASSMNNYYGKEVVPEADIMVIKKGINKRNAIIFVATVCFISLLGVFVYRFVRRILQRKK